MFVRLRNSVWRNSLPNPLKYYSNTRIMNAPSVDTDVADVEKASGAHDDPVFQEEESGVSLEPPNNDDELHIPEAEMNYLRSKIHVRIRENQIHV